MTVTAWDPAATTTVEDNTPETLATLRLPITYLEAAKGLLLSPPNTIHQVTEALEQIMAEEAAADRPFIAAMVISKARGGLPAPGFFDCAARLGRFAGCRLARRGGRSLWPCVGRIRFAAARHGQCFRYRRHGARP